MKSVAFQYKYPFHDQVLIYAQRPSAVACAELEVWNKSFGRWVNRGSKGIALIRDAGGRQGLRHVFDVADTHQREENVFKLWMVRKEYHQEIITALENRFGELSLKSSIENAIISACLL